MVFATHYLEEADAFADRIVLIARGRIVADGSTSEIKGMATTRTIRATLPFVDPAELEQQPGVSRAERHGDTVSLYSADSDAVLRAFLSEYPQARDIEVAGSGLDTAFRALTGEPGTEVTVPPGGALMSATTYVRFEILRTFRNTRFFLISWSSRWCCTTSSRAPTATCRTSPAPACPFPGVLHDRHGFLGCDGRRDRRWCSHRRRAFGGVEPTATRHPAQGAHLPQLQAAQRLRPGPGEHRAAVRSRADPRRPHGLGRLGAHDRTGPDRPCSFAVLGILLGHVLTVDSMGPAIGGITALLALLGGAWGPIVGSSGVLHDVVQLIPSYWLVQAADSALSGGLWPLRGGSSWQSGPPCWPSLRLGPTAATLLGPDRAGGPRPAGPR